MSEVNDEDYPNTVYFQIIFNEKATAKEIQESYMELLFCNEWKSYDINDIIVSRSFKVEHSVVIRCEYSNEMKKDKKYISKVKKRLNSMYMPKRYVAKITEIGTDEAERLEQIYLRECQ